MSLPSTAYNFFIKPETLSDLVTNLENEPTPVKRTQIANFRTLKNSAPTPVSVIESLKQPVNLNSNQFDFSKLLKIFLGSGYSKISPLDDIKAHNDAVITHQINCLQKLITPPEVTNSSTFVFLGVEGASILSDLLSTWLCPRISKGWKFYGIRHPSCIYIWRESEENYYHSHSPESFYLDYFRALLNGKVKLNGKLDQYVEKRFTLNRLELGGHQIFLAVEVEAINQKNETVGVRLHREFSPTSIKRQLLSYWTEWVISGWKGLIVGQRDYRGFLQDVQVFTENDRNNLLHSSKVGRDECLRHQSAFLDWMDAHLNKSGPGIVHQFSWSPSDWLFADRVFCSTPSFSGQFPTWFETIHAKTILPDINNNENGNEAENEPEN